LGNAPAAGQQSDGEDVAPRRPLKADAATGEFAVVTEVAEREGIAPSNMTRVLYLTLLAPETVEAVLNGSPLKGPRFSELPTSTSSGWLQQQDAWHFVSPAAAALASLVT
jgi:hypothetical protein